MRKLTLTITNEAGEVMGSYDLECKDRPGLDVERFDAEYSLNLVKVAAQRHIFLSDLAEAPQLSMRSVIFTVNDPPQACRLWNVNELWLEVENLLLATRLNLATARMLKQLEDRYTGNGDFDRNARLDLHMEKMERFHLAVFEMVRVEDLIVRLLHEFFGEQLMEVDTSKEDWEKNLTWDKLKVALNTRGKKHRRSHPALEALSQTEYDALMRSIRGYRSTELLQLVRYRDIRTHRPAPSVDHPELAAAINSFFGRPRSPEFTFLQLYKLAQGVYSQLLKLLLDMNSVIHA